MACLPANKCHKWIKGKKGSLGKDYWKTNTLPLLPQSRIKRFPGITSLFFSLNILWPSSIMVNKCLKGHREDMWILIQPRQWSIFEFCSSPCDIPYVVNFNNSLCWILFLTLWLVLMFKSSVQDLSYFTKRSNYCQLQRNSNLTCSTAIWL